MLRNVKALVLALPMVLVVATPAAAGVGGAVVPMFPSPLNVGQILTSEITITNFSTFPNDSENLSVTGIVITPSCAASVGANCGTPDPGVFQFFSAIGDTGSSCANISFFAGTPDPVTGAFTLTPNNPIVVGPANEQGPKPPTCVVAINMSVVRMPVDSTPGDPQKTTTSLAHASLRSLTSGASGTASGGNTTTIVDPSADNTLPNISVTIPTAQPTWTTTSSPLAIGGTASDNVGVTSVTWSNAATGGSGTAAGTTSWSASVPLQAGSNAITVTARDAANNSKTDTLTVTFNASGPPVAGSVVASATAFGGFVSSPFTLSTPFSSSFAVTGCAYSTDGGTTWAAATVTGSIPSYICTKSGVTGNDGQALSLTMRATSSGGTSLPATAISRTVDAVAPATGSNAPATWVSTDQPVTLSAADGSGSGVAGTQYCTDATNTCVPGTSGLSLTVTCPANSTCQTSVRFRSSDNVGNVEAIKSALVRIDKTAPTDGALGATPGNKQIALSWPGASDSGSGVNGYKLVFATGSAPASCNAGTLLTAGIATSFIHTGLNNATTYFYRACTSDTVGNWTTGVTVSAKPMNQPPVADAGPSQTVPLGSAATLNGSDSSDPDGTIATYAWNFGDGHTAAPSASPSVSHTYTSLGTYTVTLTVTDNGGATDTATTIVSVVPAGAGGFNWAKRFGGAGSQGVNSYSMAVDKAGFVVIAGSFSGSVDFGGGALTSAGSTDIFVAKYTLAGAWVWSYRFGDVGDDAAHGVKVDSKGNVIVVGLFNGTVNFGGGPFTTPGKSDAFIAAFDKNGSPVWSKAYGSGFDDVAYAVAVDALDNVVVVGSFAGAIDFGGGGSNIIRSSFGSFDVWLAKYTSTGALSWVKRFGGTADDNGYGVATDKNGNIFFTGSFDGSADFGGGALTTAGGTDIFLAKYSPAGAYLWAKRFGGAGIDVGYSVAADSVGNVVLTGYFGDTVDFGGGTISTDGVFDTFLAKFSPIGAYLWAAGYGGTLIDEGFGMAVDKDDNVLFTGTFESVVDFGLGPLTSAGIYDIVVAKYAPDGTPTWTKRYGSTGQDIGYAVAADPIGNAIVTGMFQGTVDFGGGPVTAAGQSDLFILSLKP